MYIHAVYLFVTNIHGKATNFIELSYFGRYRDDCLSLWNGSESRLKEFFEFMNSLDPNIKFTMEIGGKSLCFLDLKLTIENEKIETTVYSKPTDSHLYLLDSSCHNYSSIKGIQKGVALRLRRICSSDEEYDIRSKEYIAYLVARGHNPILVTKAFSSIREMSRTTSRQKLPTKILAKCL